MSDATIAAKNGDAAAIIDAVKSLHGFSITPLSPDTPQAAVVPKGMKIKNLKEMVDAWRKTPDRVRQTVAAGTVDALIEYVNRFKQPATLGFFDADDVRGVLVAIDYHEAAAAIKPGEASHVTHLCAYRFPLSYELKTWMKFAATPQSSQDFAEFLLDRACDIESPPIDWMMVEEQTLKQVTDALNLHDDRVPMSIRKDDRGDYVGVEELAAEFAAASPFADEEDAEPEEIHVPRTAIYKLRHIRFASAQTIASMARNVQINSNSKAKSAYDPKTGNTSIIFEEESQTVSKSGQRVKTPDGFFLYIPVFRGEPPRLIPCRLRTRVRGGGVNWLIEIADVNRMIDRAIAAAAERIRSETGVPMTRGLPVGATYIEALNTEAKQTRLITGNQ
jgi:uncharacterized protein YfdQ (DUF2303 family)